MSSFNKARIGTTDFDISPSPSGTLETDDTKSSYFVSNDVSQEEATSWTDTDTIAATETNSSIFSKITSMIKNIRFLHNKVGTDSMGTTATTVTGAISEVNSGLSGKADKSEIPTVPTNVSAFTNDSGYITSSGSCNYATTAGSAPASDVYSWAKASSKPSYDYTEITNLGSASVNYATSAGSAQPVFNNSTWYAVGDDAAIGDHDQGGSFCVKGLNASPSIKLYDSSNNYVSTVVTTANFSLSGSTLTITI